MEVMGSSNQLLPIFYICSFEFLSKLGLKGQNISFENFEIGFYPPTTTFTIIGIVWLAISLGNE